MLDSMRDLLEDLGGGLGVTDPVSGDIVVKLDASRVARGRPAKGRREPAKKKTKAGKRKRR